MNNINYKGINYPTKTFSVIMDDGEASEITIATESLNIALHNGKEEIEEYDEEIIDEGIYFYVSSIEILNLSNSIIAWNHLDKSFKLSDDENIPVVDNNIHQAVILCYTIRRTIRGKITDCNFLKIYAEENEAKQSPLEQAEAKRNKMQTFYENHRTHELYTWNIAKVVSTNEHYNISETDDKTISINMRHDASIGIN